MKSIFLALGLCAIYTTAQASGQEQLNEYLQNRSWTKWIATRFTGDQQEADLRADIALELSDEIRNRNQQIEFYTYCTACTIAGFCAGYSVCTLQTWIAKK